MRREREREYERKCSSLVIPHSTGRGKKNKFARLNRRDGGVNGSRRVYARLFVFFFAGRGGGGGEKRGSKVRQRRSKRTAFGEERRLRNFKLFRVVAESGERKLARASDPFNERRGELLSSRTDRSRVNQFSRVRAEAATFECESVILEFSLLPAERSTRVTRCHVRCSSGSNVSRISVPGNCISGGCCRKERIRARMSSGADGSL